MVSLKHPNLIKLLDHDKDKFEWFVMEFHPNGNLTKWGSKYKGYPLKVLLAIRPIIEGVTKIHENSLVHRDIKPKNIFVASSGQLVLGDFGIVLIPDQERLTQGTTPGSPDWVAPWVRNKSEAINYTPAVDAFMLAEVIYYMLTEEKVEPSQLQEGEEDYDVRKKFPDNVAEMELMHDFFKTSIVTNKRKACKDAKELLDRVDIVINRLTKQEPVLLSNWFSTRPGEDIELRISSEELER